MITQHFYTGEEMWSQVLTNLLGGSLDTEIESSRNGKVREVLGYSFIIDDVDSTWIWNSTRKLSAAYGAAEFLWYLSGKSSADAIKFYAPRYENYLDDGVNAHGAYGKRWKDGNLIRLCWEMLRDFPNTRQAVMPIFNAKDTYAARWITSKDIPCTESLHFLVRDDLLNLIVTMRSNDAWLGLPYDMWCFTQLQRIMANMLDLETGWYKHQVGSLHLYERNWEKASEAVQVYEASEAPEWPDRKNKITITCMDDFEKMTERAVWLEEKYRTEEDANTALLDNTLVPGSLLWECVAVCAFKASGYIHKDLDKRLIS